jgi:hypothetical protein
MLRNRTGTPTGMSPRETDRPMDLEGVPDEEGISQRDAADRVDLSPEEQKNFTDPDVEEQP